MHRRGFLASGAATVLSGCSGVGAVTPLLQGATAKWPPLGKFVTPDGARLHAWDQGEGQPVIMLHGASGNLRDFTFDLAPRLAQRYRAIAFDRPGLGYSERPVGMAGDPAAQARLLSRGAAALGIRRPILVGHSLGAAVAMAWALAEPDNIAGIVTVSGAVMPWSTTPMLVEMVGLDEVLIDFYFDYLQASAANGGIERFVNRIFRPQSVPQGYTAYVGGPLSLREETLEANKQDIAALNPGLRRQAPDYPGMKVPVEVISGTEDFIIDPARQPIPFVERLPNARLTLLDGVGHMAHHVAADQVMAAIDRISGVT